MDPLSALQRLASNAENALTRKLLSFDMIPVILLSVCPVLTRETNE